MHRRPQRCERRWHRPPAGSPGGAVQASRASLARRMLPATGRLQRKTGVAHGSHDGIEGISALPDLLLDEALSSGPESG